MVGGKATSMKLLIATVTNLKGVVFRRISFGHVTAVIYRFEVVELQYKGRERRKRVVECYLMNLIDYRTLFEPCEVLSYIVITDLPL